MADRLLEVRDLQTSFRMRDGVVRAVDGATFGVDRGEVLGLVGESGCGKSVTWLGVLGLLGKHTRVTGSVKFKDRELLGLSDTELSQIRGRKIAMIFQDPSSSLNPAQRVGAQIAESLDLHRGLRGAEASAEVLALLDQVEIPDAKRRMNAYPHELSGGMNQRVMIAMSIACKPLMLIADEPTTALDVTVQSQILNLLDGLKASMNMGMLLITHDFGVVSDVADDVVVMFRGNVVEAGPVAEVLNNPQHPYTKALLACVPDAEGKKPLQPIDYAWLAENRRQTQMHNQEQA